MSDMLMLFRLWRIINKRMRRNSHKGCIVILESKMSNRKKNRKLLHKVSEIMLLDSNRNKKKSNNYSI